MKPMTCRQDLSQELLHYHRSLISFKIFSSQIWFPVSRHRWENSEKKSYAHLRRLLVPSGIVQLDRISPDRRETNTDAVASTCFQFSKGFWLMIWEFCRKFCLLHGSKYICLWSVLSLNYFNTHFFALTIQSTERNNLILWRIKVQCSIQTVETSQNSPTISCIW